MNFGLAIAIFLAVIVLAATLAGHVLILFGYSVYIDRRVSKAIKNALRHAASYKRQTDKSIGQAVLQFEAQTLKADANGKATVEKCVQVLEAIRADIVRMIQKPVVADEDKTPPSRTLPFSLEAVRKKMEERLAEEIRTEAIQPKTGTDK